MKLYICKGYWKDTEEEFDGVTICSTNNDDVVENDDDIFYYAIGVPVLGHHDDFVITDARRFDQAEIYLKKFDVYLPARVCLPARYCETIEVEAYIKFGYEFITSESSKLIDERRVYHWEQKYGKIKP